MGRVLRAAAAVAVGIVAVVAVVVKAPVVAVVAAAVLVAMAICAVVCALRNRSDTDDEDDDEDADEYEPYEEDEDEPEEDDIESYGRCYCYDLSVEPAEDALCSVCAIEEDENEDDEIGESPYSAIPIVHDYIPISTHNKRPGTNITPTGVVIHSTANPRSTARNERGWLTNPENTSSTSWHIVVDGTEAIIAIPLNERAHHAGDGRNNTTIGIEITESGNRTTTLNNAIWMTAWTLNYLGLGTGTLEIHHGNCPRILIHSAHRAEPHQTWEWFIGEVEIALQQFN